MSFETDTDRLAMIQGCGGQAVTVGGVSVWGIFDNAYAEDIEVAGTRPQLMCRTSDVATAAYDTTVVVATVTYKVRGVQPDGTGMTTLILEQQ